jgi:hypothetical protein
MLSMKAQFDKMKRNGPNKIFLEEVERSANELHEESKKDS